MEKMRSERTSAHTQGSAMFLAAQVIGEIQAGVAKLRRGGREQAKERAGAYELWLDGLIADFGDRILEFGSEAARVWGTLLSNDRKDPHAIDKQIAAIALVNSLMVITRDKEDAFSRIPNVRVLNPFSDGPDNDNGDETVSGAEPPLPMRKYAHLLLYGIHILFGWRD
jgi:predicted nucleic acid-binding protein